MAEDPLDNEAPDDDVAVSRPSRRTVWTRRLPWIVIVVGAVLYWSALRSDVQSSRDLIAAQEHIALDRVENRIVQDIERQTSFLLSIDALFDASDEVTRAEFGQFVRASNALQRNREIRAIEWAPLVLPADMDRFTESVRSDDSLSDGGFPDFAVQTEGDRPWMAVVSFVEPMAGNEATFGFDLTSTPDRRQAVELARSTGMVTASAPIELLQDINSATGVLLVQAVHGSESDELDDFLGVTVTVFDVAAMLDATNDLLPGFVLNDVGPIGQQDPAPARLLYRSEPDILPSDSVREIEIAGRRWSLTLAVGAIPARSNVSIFLATIPQLFALAAVAWALYIFGRSSTIAENRAESLTREVRTKNGALEQSNEWLESFTRVASHDLRSPLRAVNSLVGFIREDNESLDESTAYNLGRIEERVARMNTLIDDLLTLSRISDASEQIEQVEYQRIVDEVLGTVNIPATFSVATTLEGHPTGTLAATQFKTCIYNLVDNAVKHHDRVDGKIELILNSSDDQVDVTVSDDGAGIPDEYLDSIFEPFRRLRPDETSPGSGIGLTTLLRTATNEGGNITVESTVGQGTTFKLHWPVEAPTP